MLQGNEKNNQRTRLSDQERTSRIEINPIERKFSGKHALSDPCKDRETRKAKESTVESESPVPGGGKQGGNSGEEEEGEPLRERWMGHK
jgi:hypothetical protein